MAAFLLAFQVCALIICQIRCQDYTQLDLLQNNQQVQATRVSFFKIDVAPQAANYLYMNVSVDQFPPELNKLILVRVCKDSAMNQITDQNAILSNEAYSNLSCRSDLNAFSLRQSN